jgi:hypothetical protein
LIFVGQRMAPSLAPFNVDEAVRAILDANEALSIRALKLYELQLAILLCQRPVVRKKGAPSRNGTQTLRPGRGYVVWVDASIFRRGCAYAVTHLLEHIEKTDKGANGEAGMASRLAGDEDYTRLMQSFHELGGWFTMRSTRNARSLRALFRINAAQARDTARVIAFSLRFKTLPDFPRILGGLTTARIVLNELRDDCPKECMAFKPAHAWSTLRTYWERHQYVATLIYLASFEGEHLLRSTNLAGKAFASILLRKASDRDAFARCISRHNAISRYLARYRGYSTTEIKCSGLPKCEIGQLDPLPDHLVLLSKPAR